MNFWEWLTQQGAIKGDPTYYSTGAAGDGELTHALSVATQSTVSADVWAQLVAVGAIQGDPTYYSSGQASPDEVTHALNVATQFFSGGADPQVAAEAGSPPPLPADISPGASATGATGEYPGILAGGSVVQVERAGLPDLFVAAYEFPAGSGKFVAWQFDSEEQISQILGPDWYKSYGFQQRSETWLRNQQLLDSVAEITGLSGDFRAVMESAAFEAARIAGISDPTMVGQILNDPEMQTILAQATFGNWTAEQVAAERRKTTFWTQTLYPGIDKFYGRTTNPEQAWATYEKSVEPALLELGYGRDPDGSFRSTVGQLLSANVEPQAFSEMTPVFVRAQQSEEFFGALNQWSTRILGQPLTFDDWFSVLDGNAPPALRDLAEAATVQYVANQRGTSLSASQIERFVAAGAITEAQAESVVADFDRALTALGERGLDRYDLTKDEIFALAGGIRPESGRSIETIRTKAAQAMREEGLLDDNKLQLFVGYDPSRGTPFRPGLNPLAPEVA